MKKLLFVSILAFALASCTKDNGGTDPNPGGEGTAQYLHVNFVSNVSGTKATAGGYEDGTTNNESFVKEVRLYFFDNTGNPKFVTADNKSYKTIEGMDSTAQDMNNVEKILGATVVIENIKKADDVPAYVVAILNPTDAILQTNYKLSDLQDVVAAVPLSAESRGTNGFVMSNSVYYDGTDVAIATAISTDNYAATAEAAKAKPVTIHVERTVAKVSLNVSYSDKLAGHDNTFSTQQKDANGNFIYVQFDGWTVTGVADNSYVIKKIEKDWGTTAPFANWNDASLYRSFWAENPSSLTYSYTSYNTSKPVEGFLTAERSTTPNFTYVRENAAKDDSGEDAATKTQVIIAGTLVDHEGNTLEIADYAGVKYYNAPGEAEKSLKTVFANLLDGKVYKIEQAGDNVSAEKLKPEDIKFRLATPEDTGSDKAESETPGRYFVYACLANDNPEGYDWSSSNEAGRPYDEDEDEALSVEDVNNLLKNQGHAKIWKSGMTYYYFDIEHFGSNGKGVNGVVRNHVYEANISNLSGLGTPVYEPGKTIWPEHTVEENIIIAAEIRILSWRIVSQDVSLVW